MQPGDLPGCHPCGMIPHSPGYVNHPERQGPRTARAPPARTRPFAVNPACGPRRRRVTPESAADYRKMAFSAPKDEVSVDTGVPQMSLIGDALLRGAGVPIVKSATLLSVST